MTPYRDNQKPDAVAEFSDAELRDIKALKKRYWHTDWNLALAIVGAIATFALALPTTDALEARFPGACPDCVRRAGLATSALAVLCVGWIATFTIDRFRTARTVKKAAAEIEKWESLIGKNR